MARLGAMKRKVGVGVVVLVIVAASGIAWSLHHADTGPPSPSDVQSPVRTTEAWFAAFNARDTPLAQAYFAPADRDQMDWSSWGQPFTDLNCSLGPHRQRLAVVNCTFATQNDPNSEMSNVDGWSVSMTRELFRRWLITTYGQV
jgi:hypothetical protein